MSADSAIRPIHAAAPKAGVDERRAVAYHRSIDALRMRFRRRARLNGFAANIVSILLVGAGAAVGLSAIVPRDVQLTALLGVAVILLEGVTRVLRPAQRAGRARRVADELDKEFRLYAAQGLAYRNGGTDADAAFIGNVERILQRALAVEEREDAGAAPPPPRRPS